MRVGVFTDPHYIKSLTINHLSVTYKSLTSYCAETCDSVSGLVFRILNSHPQYSWL